MIPGIELLLAYVVIVSGWVGYSRSMIKWPHTNTKSGTLRFVLDLAILFCYFGLIALADPPNDFQDHFVLWIIAMFALFSVWDMVKLVENRTERPGDRLLVSFFKTAFFLIFFLSISLIYSLISGLIETMEKSDVLISADAFYGIFLVVVTVFMIGYRYWKWSVLPQRRSLSYPH